MLRSGTGEKRSSLSQTASPARNDLQHRVFLHFVSFLLVVKPVQTHQRIYSYFWDHTCSFYQASVSTNNTSFQKTGTYAYCSAVALAWNVLVVTMHPYLDISVDTETERVDLYYCLVHIMGAAIILVGTIPDIELHLCSPPALGWLLMMMLKSV